MIVQELGAGGQGHVYIVRDKLLDELFAMKLVTPVNGLDRYLEEARAICLPTR